MNKYNKILIKNGIIYDPVQELNGIASDLYISDGKFCEPFKDPEITIDAGRRAVFAGGIDPFCHAALPGSDFLHMYKSFPSLKEIGENYAKYGYTHIHQPITTLLTAGSVWRSLNKIPYVDKSCLASIDFRDMGRYIKGNNPEEFISQAKVLTKLTGAIGLLLPFPALKHKQRHYMHMNISQKKTFGFLSSLEDQLLFPIHLWGQPGLLDAEISNPHNFHISDIGRVITSEDDLKKVWDFLDTGGSIDINLKDRKQNLSIKPDTPAMEGSISYDIGLVHPMNYSITEKPAAENEHLIWNLLSEQKSNLKISISGQNLVNNSESRPTPLASLLLDENSRPDKANSLPGVSDIDLYDLARYTRSGPAQSLGIKDIGNLKTGSRATVSIYDIKDESNSNEILDAFKNCRLLIKDGILVRKDSEFTGDLPPLKHINADIDAFAASFSKSDLLQRPTLRWENLNVNIEYH